VLYMYVCSIVRYYGCRECFWVQDDGVVEDFSALSDIMSCIAMLCIGRNYASSGHL
jgi:hypothetical protein